MTTKNWHRAVHDAERERDNALAQLAHEQANRREWQAQYQAEHRDYLNEVEAKLTRLREGIEALTERTQQWLDADPDREDNTYVAGLARAYTQDITALRALLDGEAKG